MVLHGPIWFCTVRYGPIQSHMVLDGHIWSHFVLYGLVWSSVVLFGPTWSYIVLYGPRWPMPHKAPYVSLCYLMFAFVQLTQRLHKFCACFCGVSPPSADRDSLVLLRDRRTFSTFVASSSSSRVSLPGSIFEDESSDLF